ncbi:MAG: hypothetical protein QOF48_3463 [Verrucomicrobiota bacterium]|jgi:hypothetical protein
MRTRTLCGIIAAIAVPSLFFVGGNLLQRRPQPTPAAEGVPTLSVSPTAKVPRAGSKPLLALPPGTQTFWSQSSAQPEFAAFAEWTARYMAATSESARTTLQPAGVELARVRLQAMASLIETNPERALTLAIPLSVRQQLPPDIHAFLEEPINALGRLEVLGFQPETGREAGVRPVLRYAEIHGERHQVFTYGDGLGFITRSDVPLNGIRVPTALLAQTPPANGLAPSRYLMALSESPARLLDTAELAYLKQNLQNAGAPEPVCSVSGKGWNANNEATAVQLGGNLHQFCATVHAEDWVKAAVAASGLEGPIFEPASLSEAASDTYTTGRKRFLIMRPGFSDLTNTMSDAVVPSHFNSFSNQMYEMSYGRLVFAGLGHGSDATPIMKLPGNAAEYDNTGLGKLYDTCKAVAQTNYGFNLAQYDFFYVVTGNQPAAGYAGLGFVRGVGFHLANGYFSSGTAAHEFGHNLGLNHANFWSTLGKTIIGTGNSVEYGDGNDPMGGAGSSPQHYGSRYKNYLTWIADADVATINSANSGTYRLYDFDQADVPGGLRGLRIVRTSGQNYWVQFRQRFGSKAMFNGVQLLWTGNGNQSSLLLDARLKDGSGDSALVVGRTFSDGALGMHVTPIGKAHTYPESIDVVVNVGTFPANVPPVCRVSVSATNVNAGQSVTVNAVATDSNGDPLSYFWEFGDGDYGIDNSPAATHAFTSSGEYLIQCTVSDMKGGTARDSVLVRVASPTTFRISGRVLRLDQRPLAGIRVSADATHSAWSDSDGTYAITGLAPGSYTLSALETVSASPTFIHPFFGNPVIVGPNAANLDFIVGTGAPPVAIVAVGSTWKYLATGVDQGTAWRAPAFDDTIWPTGTAQFGYGEGDEATVISYGPNPLAKYTTSYFRRAFPVANAGMLTNLTVSLLRDDGGIVYLNGVEIFRSNMPAGAASYSTFASGAIDDQVFFSGPVPNGVLVTGNNVLAVEIHQADLTTSDASFDLHLDAENTGGQAQGAVAYLTSPESRAIFTAPVNLSLDAVALVTSGSVTNVEFYDGATKLGIDLSSPFSLPWNNTPVGSHSLTIRAKSTTGMSATSGPVNFSVVLPSSAPPPVVLPLVSAGAMWRYLASASDAPSAWITPAFNDLAWPAGFAELGYGDGPDGRPETTTIPYGGNAANKWITSYYRRAFTVNDPTAVTNLLLHLKRDDGAVVYLNGAEVLRDNMPSGAISWSTLATNGAPDDGAIFLDFPLNPSALVVGSNLVAVEIHQATIASSDISFDLALDATASTNRPRGVYLASPTDGSTVPSPSTVTIAAEVVAGGSLGVDKVEYFSDGIKIGELTHPPFEFVWSNPAPGSHQLTAVATDAASSGITSAPVTITVLSPPTGTALVSFGDMWKYLDDGTMPVVAWTGRLFDDRSWPAGPARLGYGGDGELTTVSYGTDPNIKHISTYFRRSFIVGNPAAFSGLLLRLSRDDGAVVYLNGIEVLRDNLLPGLVSWNSLAVTAINAPDEMTPIDILLGTAGLVSGTNVLAVEIHQAAPGSSDLGFDLALIGLTSTNTAQGIYITSPADGTHYNAPVSIGLSSFAASMDPVSLVEYFDANSKIGQATASPYLFTWSAPSLGTHFLSARATFAGGLQATSPAVRVVVGYPPAPVLPIFDSILQAGSIWKYWDNVSAVAAGWQTTGFSDASWPSAAARFGYGLDGEVTTLTQGRTTVYFRKWMTVTNPFVLSDLVFRLQRDDGAVVYLNGAEIFRSNMPTGPIVASTTAATTVNTPEETMFFETILPARLLGLMTGSNLVAVELHQASATSSDAGFDMQVIASGTTEPRIYFSSPADGSSFSTGASISLDGNAFAGTGYGVAKVEVFADSIKLGETNAVPFHFNWPAPGMGSHTVLARMTDTRGAAVDSSLLNISIGRESFTSTLIASNSVWKYLDNGSNQGTNWAQPGFNDSTWASGPARLGYGGDGEITTVSFGPNSNAKYTTTYFRKSFVVLPGSVYTNLGFKLARDDGAVVYVNGREAYRDNMPTGSVIYTTFSATSASDEQSFFPTNIAINNLPTGPNVIAVEVHQTSLGSGDLGFNLEVKGSGYSDDSSVPTATVELADGMIEISWPSTYTNWRIYSSPDAWLPMSQWQPISSMPVIAGGRIVVTIPPSGQTEFFRLGRP